MKLTKDLKRLKWNRSCVCPPCFDGDWSVAVLVRTVLGNVWVGQALRRDAKRNTVHDWFIHENIVDTGVEHTCELPENDHKQDRVIGWRLMPTLNQMVKMSRTTHGLEYANQKLDMAFRVIKGEWEKEAGKQLLKEAVEDMQKMIGKRRTDELVLKKLKCSAKCHIELKGLMDIKVKGKKK